MRHLLHEDEHLVLEKIAGEPILVLRRKATMPSAETIRSFAGTIKKALAASDRSRHAMLIDLRAAPMRVGNDIEPALATFREEAHRDAVAIARLVATSVGALQVQRLAGEERQPTRSFSDENDALAWLRTQLSQTRPHRPR